MRLDNLPKNAAQSTPQSGPQSAPQTGDAPRGSLVALLRRHEGVRARLYQDSLGYWTIGVGHVVDRRKGGWCDDGLAQRLNAHGFCLSERVINAYLADDLAEAEQTIWDLLSPPAGLINQPGYEALVSMAFNLGRGGFAGFKRRGRRLRRVIGNAPMMSCWIAAGQSKCQTVRVTLPAPFSPGRHRADAKLRIRSFL